MSQIKIVSSPHPENVERECNRLLAEGYKPYGEICLAMGREFYYDGSHRDRTFYTLVMLKEE